MAGYNDVHPENTQAAMDATRKAEQFEDRVYKLSVRAIKVFAELQKEIWESDDNVIDPLAEFVDDLERSLSELETKLHIDPNEG